NILVERGAGGKPKAFVLDFRLAREVDATTTTAGGHPLGTPAYFSPEQARGDRTIDGRTDVYALGATLYELLTGRPPFQGPIAEVVYQVLEVEPPPPRKLWAGVPPDMETVVLKCLEKKPAARYQSAGALGADLRRFLEGKPISARAA